MFVVGFELLWLMNSGQMYPHTLCCQGFQTVSPENVEKTGVLFISAPVARPQQGFQKYAPDHFSKTVGSTAMRMDIPPHRPG
jgi:hypothetical protein